MAERLMDPKLLALIDQVVTDPAGRARIAAALVQLQTQAEASAVIEGPSGTKFSGAWRPTSAWVCVAGLALQYVIGPLLEWGGNLAGLNIQFPALDGASLTAMVGTLLGLGGMRAAERIKGVVPSPPTRGK